jgi:glutamate dehydrogenase (NAD(P)+)
MTVYSGLVFEMAAKQFNVIANHLEIPMDERDRLLMPKRAVTVSCPIHRDDGTVAVFEGYRVQHHLTSTAAMAIGVEKVRTAKNTRGLFP